MKKINSSGQTLIILLVAILLVALFSIYTINRVYFKQSSRQMKENNLEESDINQPATLPNAQKQVDAVRDQMNEIQNDYNKKLDESMPKP